MEIDRVWNNKMIVIADTNALLLPFKHKFNIDFELEGLVGNHEIIIPEPIVGELKKLALQNRVAKAALKLANTKKTMPTKFAGDDSVLELAERLKAIVFTSDKQLIDKAKSKGLKIIRLKEGNRLGFDNDWID
jgi:rRNA-processing protein FCF1